MRRAALQVVAVGSLIVLAGCGAERNLAEVPEVSDPPTVVEESPVPTLDLPTDPDGNTEPPAGDEFGSDDGEE